MLYAMTSENLAGDTLIKSTTHGNCLIIWVRCSCCIASLEFKGMFIVVGECYGVRMDSIDVEEEA